MKNRFKVASFFSGCSGSDYGFAKEGFDIVFSNEINPYACDTYEANFHKKPFEVPLEKIPSSVLEGIKADVVIGGPPCQSFSNANSRGLKGGYRNCSGINNVEEMARAVFAIKPTIVICENAPTLTDPSMQHVFFQFLDLFANCGYIVKYFKLNTENYGIPQHRERSFFVGIRTDIKQHFYKPTGEHWSEKYLGWADYLNVEVPSTGVWYHNRSSSIKGYSPYEATTTVLSSETPVVRYKQPNRINKILKLEREALGINQRFLTVRELAKLQGFPDDYIFKGSSDEIIKMIGNAWSVNVARALARESRRVLCQILEC